MNAQGIRHRVWECTLVVFEVFDSSCRVSVNEYCFSNSLNLGADEEGVGFYRPTTDSTPSSV